MSMIGWAILGCGDVTDRRVAPAVVAQEQSRLVAMHSRSAARAAEVAGRHGALRWSSERAEVLADPEVHAVYVATEHYRHAEDVIAAAEAGKAVLCEKPLATTAAEGRRMVDACRAQGVPLQVAYYRRYYPKLLRMHDLLQQGAIGSPVTARAQHAQRLSAEQLAEADWRLNTELSGGGPLVDTGSHRLDLLCWLLGEPDAVGAFVECREWPVAVPDMETLLVRMRSGAHLTYRTTLRASLEDEFEIDGTGGRLSATPLDGPVLRLTTPEGEHAWELPRHANPHFPLIDDFTRRLIEGLPPRHDGEDGLAATRMIDAAYESGRSGRIIGL